MTKGLKAIKEQEIKCYETAKEAYHEHAQIAMDGGYCDAALFYMLQAAEMSKHIEKIRKELAS